MAKSTAMKDALKHFMDTGNFKSGHRTTLKENFNKLPDNAKRKLYEKDQSLAPKDFDIKDVTPIKKTDNDLDVSSIVERNSHGGQAKGTLSWMKHNALERADGTGWGVAKRAGAHAAQGAVVGGLAGGTIEGVQGGSFWTGFKEGAFNGAVGYTGARGAMDMTGRKNFVAGAFNMYNSQSGKNVKIANSAKNLLNHNQMTGYNNMIMNKR